MILLSQTSIVVYYIITIVFKIMRMQYSINIKEVRNGENIINRL